ncbi:BZIP transcription factor [Colletotrichum tofieldiae]|nr:BZIP transcription factor [Colletotrichum tofieldiae]
MAENINKSLNYEAAQLRGEILMLKNMVLQHGGCGCSYIEEYISGAAQSLVQSSMAAAGSTHGGGMQIHDQNCANGAGGEGYVDWKMFDMDTKAGLSSLESESGFSGYDDSASHSARAQSQGPRWSEKPWYHVGKDGDGEKGLVPGSNIDGTVIKDEYRR